MFSLFTPAAKHVASSSSSTRSTKSNRSSTSTKSSQSQKSTKSLSPEEQAARRERRRQRQAKRDAEARKAAEVTLNSGLSPISFKKKKNKSSSRRSSVIEANKKLAAEAKTTKLIPRKPTVTFEDVLGGLKRSRKSPSGTVVIMKHVPKREGPRYHTIPIDQRLVVTLTMNTKTWRMGWNAKLQ